MTLSSPLPGWEGLGDSRTAQSHGAGIPGQNFSISYIPDSLSSPSLQITVCHCEHLVDSFPNKASTGCNLHLQRLEGSAARGHKLASPINPAPTLSHQALCGPPSWDCRRQESREWRQALASRRQGIISPAPIWEGTEIKDKLLHPTQRLLSQLILLSCHSAHRNLFAASTPSDI